MSEILSLFPLANPRPSQVEVIKAIEEAYKEGYKTVILEAPVGSGKSAIAVTISKYFGEAHMLTPMKSLQDQYHEDFHSEKLVLMKGRSSYPCTYMDRERYQKQINIIKSGGIPKIGNVSCAEGPCITSVNIKSKCVDNDTYPCPYNVAAEVAQNHEYIVHNLHSFIFQAYFSNKFDKRKLLVIDECHKVEEILRGFASKKITFNRLFTKEEIESSNNNKDLLDWSNWFRSFQSEFSDRKLNLSVLSDRENFNGLIDDIESFDTIFKEAFVKDIKLDERYRRTTFEFIPEKVGGLANNFLFNFGENILLMSGTIYDRDLYCKALGIDIEKTKFLRIGSSFPVNSRPIYLKKEYLVDTSHKNWKNNYDNILASIRKVLTVFHDVKGLIHAPSYAIAQDLQRSLSDTKRVVIHTPDNFQPVLSNFYDSDKPHVLISPVCQQGVDFKYNRARFQIILRVPYLNTSDAFISEKMQRDFSWYNYQALVIFGQQVGRVNRAEDDFGATILLDSRFPNFINKNRNILPKWLLQGLVT